MTSQPQRHSQTAAITLAQLAAIAGRDPSYFSLHKDELPEPVPIHNGIEGRPQIAYSLEQLSELVIERTGHLSDAICRLRLALSGHRQPADKDRARMQNLKTPGLFRLIEDAEGNHIVLPDNLSSLTPDLYAKVRSAIASEHADTRARRPTRTNPAAATEPQGEIQ
ncbi:hypothetical protein C4K31_3384 [Pseudomonas chlororaphis subsp. piscium]|uniref:hypothetical protein n=1 Tax=Pseudomonas chlororaphis TaxID=587753 RepID=UPI000F57A750|nr:hypothetical protein [Pseudomonas chlororaphis]AZC76287.1 hypothetical protein C4K31_3384 [Pseudomonas chlororaphis subsp. piscium]